MKTPFILPLYCFAFLSAQLLLTSGGQDIAKGTEQNYEQKTKLNDTRNTKPHTLMMVVCDKMYNCFCDWSPDRAPYLIDCISETSADSVIAIYLSEDQSKINITCYRVIEFNISVFPNLNITNLNEVNINRCPLANRSYGDLVKKFNIFRIMKFQMDHMDLDGSINKTLTRTHFEGLELAQTVLVKSNELLEIDADAFVPLKNVQFLNVFNNTLKLRPRMFSNNRHMRLINLSRNELEVIPDDTFANLSVLNYLFLNDNKIKKLGESTFKGLRYLKSLNLHSNEIEAISEKAFEPLVKMLKLNMASNKLAVLPQNVFGKNSDLDILRLDDNPELVLSDNLFANLRSLTLLGLTRCNLTELPQHVFDGMPSLNVLELSKNLIRELPKKIFSKLTGLIELKLDDNAMEAVPDLSNLNNLMVLNLSRNMITNVGDGAFEDLENLKSLNLEYNRVVVHPNALLPMPKLNDVSFGSNNLATFDCDLLRSNVNIKRIYLGDNRLTELPIGCFDNKRNLVLLDLSNNLLSTLRLMELNSTDLPSTIDMRSNNITLVDFTDVDLSSDLSLLTEGEEEGEYLVEVEEEEEEEEGVEEKFVIKLSSLLLDYNPIVCDCHAYALNRYFNKWVINKYKNWIQITGATCGSPTNLRGRSFPVPPKTLFCPYDLIDRGFKCPEECNWCRYYPRRNMMMFNCNNKNLKDYPKITHPTTKLYDTTVFHFEHNALERGPEETWSGWNGIEELYLNNNRIQNISWIQNSLKTLSLLGNNLTTMPDKVLEQIESSDLRSLKLMNNPWSCDCDAKKFASFIRLHLNLCQTSC